MSKVQKLGEINISEIKLDKKSQDDVPRILIGLQTLHNDEEAREEVMQILSKEVLPNTRCSRYDVPHTLS